MRENIKYSLELNKFLKYSIWALPILSAIIFILFFIYADIEKIKLLYALPFFGYAFWNWAKYFNRPIRINVFEDYATMYNVFNKETKINFRDIYSIESNSSKVLIIRTKSDKIFGVNGFSQFSKFLEHVKNVNTEIIIKGL
jgi:hypothetical protein